MSQEEQNRPERETHAQPRRARQPSAEQPVRRRRKSRRRVGVSLSLALLYVMFIIGLSVLLATLGWTWANDVLALNKEPMAVVITVREGDTFSTVADQLHESGLIEYKWLFNLFATLSKGKDKLATGTYELDSEMDYRALITNMSARSAARQEISVTIPEGYTVAQIFKLLEEQGVSTVEKLNDMAATHDYKFSFLADLPLGSPARLEGYLFPDTYKFYLGESPLYVINKMLVNFDARLTETMRRQITEKGLTVREIVIIASMIEKETDGGDQTKISSVIFNRLNTNTTNGLLNIDATIQYILPERKENLSNADLLIDNPYNTYLYPGLPPGPIANPGIAALRSAMNPESTNYYYYALGNDGVHHFFKTYNEHLNFLDSLKS